MDSDGSSNDDGDDDDIMCCYLGFKPPFLKLYNAYLQFIYVPVSYIKS